ncbi:MAG: hypothetical protein M1470_13780 [Bacteroidetes bacterium]|nr:hypothetical protein [Bacteroidota bacterium]
MIAKVYPTVADFENLSRVHTEPSREANTFDYSKVVVLKPWGYEYLWYQNSSVAVWMLCLKPGHATSLHCHLRKRSSLIVLAGNVMCSTLENRYKLRPMDAMVLEPCVFHTSEAISNDGAFIIEVENPPMKGDLVRMKDNFGREGTAYESAKHYSTDFNEYAYQPFTPNDRYQFNTINFALRSLQTPDDAHQICSETQLIVPFLGRLVAGRSVLVEIGEAVRSADLDLTLLPPVFPPVQVLSIHRMEKEM